MSRIFFRLATVLLFTSTVFGIDAPVSESEREFFENRIRPVLVAECYECHSGDTEELKGGLRLDTRELTR
ncbi:c-type cytochrome domain-containing protein [Planctomycetota bacterium]